MPQGLPFHLKDYIELVDLIGRAIREYKRRFIDNQLPPILDRLNTKRFCINIYRKNLIA